MKRDETTDLSHPGARELLTTGWLAYAGQDGLPRVIPIGFHGDGRQIIVCSATTAPKVRALSRRPDVVVTHRPRPDGWHPQASCRFVDDVGAAIEVAKDLAGERDVAVAAGDVGGQALALVWSTRSRWTSCPWCSAPAGATSGRLTRSTS
jgi:hypothetical protein